MKNEAKLKSEVRAEIKRLSPEIEKRIIPIPASPCSAGGIPDWLIDYNGKALWVEFKQGKYGRLTDKQRVFLKERGVNGVIVHYAKKETDGLPITYITEGGEKDRFIVIALNRKDTMSAIAEEIIKLTKGETE